MSKIKVQMADIPDDAVRMADFPMTRASHDCRCSVCDVRVPAGLWVVQAADGAVCCTSTCLDKQVRVYAGVSRVSERELALDPDKLERKAAALEDEARDMHSEAYDMEDEAEQLRDQAERIRKNKANLDAARRFA